MKVFIGWVNISNSRLVSLSSVSRFTFLVLVNSPPYEFFF